MEAFVSVPIIKSLKFVSVSFKSEATVCDLLTTVTQTHGLPAQDFYVKNNGRLSSLDDIIQHGGLYQLEPRLPGGKGGFGSMLRALGAQIEKTTNREACRDLSGRRLRDVNHEKEMAEWLQKQGEREAEKEQRRLDRIQRKLSEPKHHFSDPQFSQQCHALSERLDDSVLKGMQASSSAVVSAGAAQEGLRGKRINKSRREDQRHAKKTCMWSGVDDLDSSEEEDDEDDEGPLSKAAQMSVESPLSNSSSDGEDRARVQGVSMETEPQSSESDAEQQPGSTGSNREPSGSNSHPSGSQIDTTGSQGDPTGSSGSQIDTTGSQGDPTGSSGSQIDTSGSTGSQGDPSSPQHCEQKQQTEAPVVPEVVTTSGPVDPEVTTSGPVDPEVTTSGPVDPEVATSGPVVPEVATTGPVVPEVATTGPVVPEVATSGPVDLEVATSAQQLEVFGLEVLKVELMKRGLKCGGTLSERAARLFSVKGLKAEQINPVLLAKKKK